MSQFRGFFRFSHIKEKQGISRFLCPILHPIFFSYNCPIENINVNKTVTFHLDRHTFATTATLEKGAMKSVSHMPGHASIRTT